MNIEIEKKDLISLIGKTLNIVEKKNTMPILINVLIEATEDKLNVYATDLEVSITDSVKAKIFGLGKVVVSAKNLFEIARELNEAPITLAKKENNWLEIKQDKYHSKIVGISSEEYPIFPSHSGENMIELPAGVLREMIDKTIYSVSTDETRYHLNGVYFEVNQNQGLKMVATDGHRLSLIHRNYDKVGLSISHGVIIPRKGLNEIKKIIEGTTELVRLSIEGSQLILVQGNTVLMIRLIEAKYPNYHQFIPQTSTQIVGVDREAFLTSIRRVALLANQKSKAILLILSKGKMEVTTNNPEVGDASQGIEIDYQGNEMRIGFNAKYISDVLSNISDDRVELELNDQLSPGLIRPSGDSTYICVVMPMRV